MKGLAIVGGGNICAALLSGLLDGDTPLVDRDQISVVEQLPDRAAYLRERFGVSTPELAEAVRASDTVVLMVKPYHIEDLLPRLAEHLTPDHLVISVIGGVSTARVESDLPKTPVVRAMPNTAASVGQAITAISAGAYAEDTHLDRAESLLRAVGKVVRVPETQLNAITAFSGSGPAFFFYFAEALIDAGVLLGLPRALSEEMVIQTAVGAAAMLRDSGDDPVHLRAAVSSPGGTTITAIRELEKAGVRGAVMAATEAGRDRTNQISEQADRTGR
ncbi:pyrroline-5-carboxylate reductase [Kribbella jiaozuonensis]|uniref:Pyrroline-5-carboxylate reductase n=1 Tax=Kribbella jiaozuonensis TaxID=2575441 RepID=A0A4U3LPJ3_9ACTN|nr:pyrroline-5-carboxylate reductase [Kribbella jiaozuonensis]TKK76257.1 pyrroline-5-carboxylate reductase [Kribbella jiaozuonensis]